MLYVAAVHYGRMNHTENFFSREAGLALGDTVIVKTARGVEIGEITSDVRGEDRDEIKGLDEILRKATEDDLSIAAHIRSQREPDEKKYCTEQIAYYRLPMKLAEVEHLFGGDKIIFYFLADGRVDFRELVKNLARKYRTRIEMRQIGVRDEARLLADYEHCGRELCCRTFMKNLEPVTMRMAKIQKTTLDPSKISGHCGRLMCCLRFEDEVYTHLRKELPGKGTRVVTREGEGNVIGHEILGQKVLVQMGDGRREMVHVSDILERRGRPGKGGGRSDQGGGRSDKSGERSDPGCRCEKSDRCGNEESEAKKDKNANEDGGAS